MTTGGTRPRRGTVLAVLALALLAVATLAAAASAWVPANMSLRFLDERLGVGAFEDEGRCHLWVRNASDPGNPDERRFPCAFSWTFEAHGDGVTRLHEELRDLERGEVLRIPGLERGRLEEWYPVVSSTRGPDAWTFAFNTEGDAGVFAPPPGARGNVTVGWVTSNGTREGPPRLQVARTFREVGVEDVGGIRAVHWESAFVREDVTWHGHDQVRSEVVETWSDPRNGFTLAKRKTVVVEMTPDEIARTQGVPVPPDAEAGEPVKVSELTYRTTGASTLQHAERIRSFQGFMTAVEAGGWVGVGLGLAAAVAAVAAVRVRRRGDPD